MTRIAHLRCEASEQDDGTSVPSYVVDESLRAILDRIVGDPTYALDRAIVVGAIRGDAHANRGTVDPDRVRCRILGGVRPQVVGAVYNALVRRGVLVAADWKLSEDRASRNLGKPARTYRMASRWLR